VHGQIHDEYLDELDGYGRLIACDEWVDGGSRQYWEVTKELAEAGCCGEEMQASSIHACSVAESLIEREEDDEEVGNLVDGDDDDGGESNVIEGRATRRWTGTVGLTGVFSVVVLNCM